MDQKVFLSSRPGSASWTGILVVASAVLVQTLLGSLYAWSVFIPPLREGYDISTTQTQWVFGTMVFVFVIIMTLMGQILDRIGARTAVVMSGLLYGGGYVLAGSVEGAFWSVLLGIGVISGAGIGAGYVAALACCVRWYPQRKGLVTGLAVSGFGGGAVIVSMLGQRLMMQGWDVLQIFQLLGWVCGGLILLLAGWIRLPVLPPTAAESYVSINPLLRRQFWASCIGIFAGTFAGLMVIGNLASMGRAGGLDSGLTTLAVAGFAVGNCLGRLVWGVVFDRLGFAVLPTSVALIGLTMLGVDLASSQPMLFLVASLGAGLMFGSCFVLFAAYVAQVFGATRLGRIYPLVFMFYGLAAIIGPPVGGWMYDRTGSYDWAVWIAACVAWSGCVALGWLGRESGRRVVMTWAVPWRASAKAE